MKTPDCIAATWYQDTNCHLETFEPVTTKALRLVIHRTTIGFAPDALANEAIRRTWGGDGLTAKLWLREIEIYGPAAEVKQSVSP